MLAVFLKLIFVKRGWHNIVMENITKRLKDFFNDKEFNKNKLCKFLALKDDTLFFMWNRGDNISNLTHLDKLALYFNCSMEYLFGRTEDLGHGKYVEMKPFDKQLKKIRLEKGITQYQMIYKDSICSSNNFHKWNKLKSVPTPETVVKLADYFNVTVDYLLGRE